MNEEEDQQARDLAAAIQELANAFIGRIPTTLSNMEQELDAIIHDSRSHESWKNLHRHLHSLAGSAGTFGYDELGDRARELEHRINSMLKADRPEVDPDRSEFMHDQRNFMEWVNAEYIRK